MITLDIAYLDWLYRFKDKNDDENCLDSTTRKMIQQMNSFLDKEEYTDVWTYYDQLLLIQESIKKPVECAEIQIWCARVQYILGNLQEAIRLYEDAIAGFPPDSHAVGIAQWMLGYVLWQIPGDREKAVATWNQCIETLESIPKNDRFISEKKSKWYKERRDETQTFLDEAVEDRGVFKNRQTIEVEGGCVSDFLVIDEFQDSKDSSPPDPEKAVVRIFRQFYIREKNYFIYNILPSDGRLIIKGVENHRILKVPGEGKQNAGISPDDFVLIIDQPWGRRNDIVLVDTIGKPSPRLFSYEEVEDKSKIIARVVAVLKEAVEPLPPIPAPPPAEKPKMSEIEVRNVKNKLGDIERQITDLEFQFKSGFVEEDEYKSQMSSLSKQREEILKKITSG